MKKFLDEFRQFAFKGNMVDLAIGMIIGSAFTALVNSVVNDLIMPVIGVLTGGIDFSNLFIPLNDAAKEFTSLSAAKDAGVPVFAYGAFLTQLLQFLIMAFVVFLFVKQMNRLRKPEPQPQKAPVKICPYCRLEVPLDAARCPHCTSELKREGAQNGTN